MRVRSLLAVLAAVCAAPGMSHHAAAQKIVPMMVKPAHVPHVHVRVHKFGRLVHGVRRHGLPRLRFKIFALPDPAVYPPWYTAPRPWRQRPDMASRTEGGLTVQQGSRWRGRIAPGRTVEGGSPWASRIAGGRTVEGGSPWGGRLRGGATVEGGSRWAGRAY